jgi:hypothetical protein
MTNRLWQLLVISTILSVSTLSGCIFLPGGTVVDSALVVHTAGSKKHTAAVQVPVAASEVFATIVRLIEDKPEWQIENRNDKAFLIEVIKGSRSLTGQVTDLGAGRSLLYVWADAGESGVTGEEMTTSVVEIVCDELGVKYELVNY